MFCAVGASFAEAFDGERLTRTFAGILPLVAMLRGKRCQDQKTKTTRASQFKKFKWSETT
ncbi:MAG: hypothetical protein WAM29_00615 [Methylocella sp.]